MNELLDATPQQDVELPPELTPSSPLNRSAGVAQFYMLNDTETGVLVLGSFAESAFDVLQESLLVGLLELRERGANRLIVDVVCRFQCVARLRADSSHFADKQWRRWALV